MSPRFPSAGDTFTCPRCGMLLWRQRRDAHFGDIIDAADAEPLGITPQPHQGDIIECWCCGKRPDDAQQIADWITPAP